MHRARLRLGTGIPSRKSFADPFVLFQRRIFEEPCRKPLSCDGLGFLLHRSLPGRQLTAATGSTRRCTLGEFDVARYEVPHDRLPTGAEGRNGIGEFAKHNRSFGQITNAILVKRQRA